MNRILVILLAVSFACVSCKEVQEEVLTAEVTGFEDMTFPYDGSTSCTFTVKSGYTWSLDVKDCDWLEVSQTSGRAGREATVTVTPAYNDDLAREGKIELSSGKYSKQITVRQDAFPIVPELTLSCDSMAGNALSFGFKDTGARTITVWSNVDWTVEKENLDWLQIDPANGTRKQETIVTVCCEANLSDARTGRLSFTGPGLEPVVVTVSQDKYVDDPVFEVTGLDSYSFELLPINAKEINFSIRSNRKWTICGAESWLTVSPSSSSQEVLNDCPVTIAASDNKTSAARACTLVLDCDDPDVQDVSIAISQLPLSSNFSAVWTLNTDVIKRNADWVSNGVAYDDVKNATMTWHRTNEASCYGGATTFTYTNSNNTYMVKSIWSGDYMEFDIPVTYVEAGTTVEVSFAVKANSGGPRFWYLEYYDQQQWKKTSVTTGAAYSGGTKVECTAYFTNGVDMTVKESFVVSETIVSGSVKVRLVCTEGQHLAKKADAAMADKAAGIYFKSGTPIRINNNQQ